MFRRKLTCCALGFVLLGSCSVKSDRALCPTLLCLNLSGGDENAMDIYIKGSDTPYLHATQISKAAGENAQVSFEIDKGKTSVIAVSGLHDCFIEDGTLFSPDSGSMDEIFAFSTDFEAEGDVKLIDGELHRQSAFLFLDIVSSDEDNYPFYVGVKSNTCGIDLGSMLPVKGSFSAMLHPILGVSHRICLPRQADDSLSLEFYDSRLHRDASSPVDKLDIGLIISASGYDWNAEDLDDIYVSLDYNDASVSVSVVPWNRVEL